MEISVLVMTYQNPALGDQCSVLMVVLAITPIGLGAHGLEPPAAAECGLKAVASGLLDNDRNQVSA
jgi:hypothetical protein